MYCPAAGPGGWPAVVAKAKGWIPQGHPSMSMLYLFDGQTSHAGRLKVAPTLSDDSAP